MANILIRNLPDKTKEILRLRAAQSGVSLEAYVRDILKQASAVNHLQPVNILDIAEKYFGVENGVAIDLPERRSQRESVDFDR